MNAATSKDKQNKAKSGKRKAEKIRGRIWNVRFEGQTSTIFASRQQTVFQSSAPSVHRFLSESGEVVACFPAEHSSFILVGGQAS